jgi:hypothetical protein
MFAPEPFLAPTEVFGRLLLIEVLGVATALKPSQASAQVAELVEKDFGFDGGHGGLVWLTEAK